MLGATVVCALGGPRPPLFAEETPCDVVRSPHSGCSDSQEGCPVSCLEEGLAANFLGCKRRGRGASQPQCSLLRPPHPQPLLLPRTPFVTALGITPSPLSKVQKGQPSPAASGPGDPCFVRASYHLCVRTPHWSPHGLRHIGHPAE